MTVQLQRIPMPAPAEIAQTDPPAASKIMTIDPPAYAAAVYQPFQDRLKTALAELPGVAYDIKTAAGMETAVQWRRTFRDIRLDADKERKARKAPVNDLAKLLESQYNELEAKVLPLEERFHADIKADEQRREAIRAEAARVELARVTGIQARIAEIRGMAETHRKTSEQIDAAWKLLDETAIAEADFAEFTGQAQNAKTETLAKLHEAYLRVETEEKERAEFARKQAEHAALVAAQVERDRVAKAAQDAAAAELKRAQEAHAEQERQAAVQRKAAQDELDRQAREQAKEQARQQAELDRQRREFEAEQARVRVEAEARQRAEQEAAAALLAPAPVQAGFTAPEPLVPSARADYRPTDDELIGWVMEKWAGATKDDVIARLEEFPLSPL